MSWNGAMDEVRVERLIKKYKDNGELDSDDPALVMLKKWPASKQYQYTSDQLPGLEQLVCIIIILYQYVQNRILLAVGQLLSTKDVQVKLTIP